MITSRRPSSVPAIALSLLVAVAPAGANDAATLVEQRADALHAIVTAAPVEAPVVERARAAFGSAGLAACPGATARIAVLGPDGEGRHMAYLISQGDAQQLYAGGHFRVELGADGSAGEPAVLGEGCDTIEWDAADEELAYRIAYLQRRAGAEGPSEIDLLLSRQAPFALGMVSPPRVWPLLGGRADEPIDADAAMAGAGE